MMRNVKGVSLNIARDDKKKIDRLSLKILFNFTCFLYKHLCVNLIQINCARLIPDAKSSIPILINESYLKIRSLVSINIILY